MKQSKKPTTKLNLHTQTVRALSAREIELAAGGFSSDTIYNTCRYGGCGSTTAYGSGSGGFSC